MVLEKLWVSANFTRVSKSRRHKLESRNFGLAKHKAGSESEASESNLKGPAEENSKNQVLLQGKR